jgi:hypothetical protein
MPRNPRLQSRALIGVLIAGSALVVALPLHAQQTDTVVTRNGDQLTGEVKSLASGRLQFRTAATDTIAIQWDHVVALTSRLFFEVVLDDGRRLFGALHEAEEPGMLRIGTEASGVEVGLGQVAQIERIRQTFWKRLKGSIDLGLSLAKANRRVDFSLNLTTNYRTQRGAWKLVYDSLYRTQDNAEDLDRQDVTASYERYLTGRWLASVFASGQRNTELALARRLITGVGGGYHIVRTVEQNLTALAGADVASEEFLDDRERTDSVEAFAGFNYALYALGNRDFIVSASAIIFPSLSVKGRLRSELSADIKRELWHDFFFSLRGFYSSDSSAGGEEDQGAKTDYGASFGVGYKW